MFTHVMVGADDIKVSKAFYDATFQALGIGSGAIDRQGRLFYQASGMAFGITVPIDGKPTCAANGGAIGFGATSPEQVDAWHEAGLKAGGAACEDPPGVREAFQAYAAYLRDPAGNKLCVSCRIPA